MHARGVKRWQPSTSYLVYVYVSSQINYGGVVPESFYLTAEKCLPASGTVTTQVGRGDSLLVDLPVKHLPCTIR